MNPPRPGLRGRAFALIDALQGRWLAACMALHQGLWLGLMDHRHLNGLAPLWYARQKQWIDDEHNATGLFAWEDRAVREFFPPTGARLVRALRFSRDPVEFGDTLDGTFDHFFTREEVAGEMAAAGFELALYETIPYGHAVGRATPTA